MKTLFIGGIKSGKSKNAEIFAVEISKQKPIYLATNEFFDDEMSLRVKKHKLQRADKFETIEEPLYLAQSIKQTKRTVLVECVSMWINNMLYHGYKEAEIFAELEKLFLHDNALVLVINDVGNSVVSDNKLVRDFVDINGRVSQYLASRCDTVFQVVAGIKVKIK